MDLGWTIDGVTHVGIDADDTLWHSENRFRETHERFRDLVAPYSALSDPELDEVLTTTEQANLSMFGYGAKAFTLSLIETAIAVTDGAIPAPAIQTLVDFGKELLSHPVELLDGVEDVLHELRARELALLLVTKGDLLHQEAKIAASGVADHFDGIEIVSEKHADTYRGVLDRHGVDPSRFCMVGNSVRSDVLPVLEIGARAVHVPYDVIWEHEVVTDHNASFPVIGDLRELLTLLD